MKLLLLLLGLASTTIFTVQGRVRAFTSCGKGRRVVSITLDDGPDLARGASNRVNDQLVKLHIPGTYFVTPAAMGDDKKQLDGRCDRIKEIQADRPDTTWGVHGWDHKMIKKGTSLDIIGKSIDKTVEFMKGCGIKPTLFRPPFGVLTDKEADYISTDRNLIIAQWNVEPNDSSSKSESEDKVFDRLRNDFEKNVGIGNGAVILLHDSMFVNRPNLIAMIFHYFHELNYKFVSGQECYDGCNEAICTGGGTGPKPGKGIYLPRKEQK